MRVLLVATFSSAVETATRRHRRDRLEAAWGVPPGKIVRARGAAAALRTAPGRTAVAHEAIDVADIAKISARHSTRALVCARPPRIERAKESHKRGLGLGSWVNPAVQSSRVRTRVTW
mmetsp:Transcript_9628/g.43823  ORF Transcript_9628/g.43823 Transcript_9628/m.43823 type:complete len:118 (+) Transcript_9628:1033-1386(+)